MITTSLVTSLADAATPVVPEKKGFLNSLTNTKLQPQIFSLILIVIILTVLAIVIYNKVKKQKVNEAPSGLLQISEQYVMGVDNLFTEATDGKFKKPAPYIFTLITFLIVSNLMGLIGLEPPTASYSTTLTLGIVSWIGIYVVGIMYQKLSFFKKFLNPVELVSQFAPLISISFRLFGNMIGGSTIMYLIYHVTGFIWGKIPVVGELNLLGSMIAPALHFYFDVFDGFIQAFVFTLLTMVYWTLEAETPKSKEAVNLSYAESVALKSVNKHSIKNKKALKETYVKKSLNK